MKTTTDTQQAQDSTIGSRIRQRRKILGFSPTHFASLLGISHQQLNKYETGINRVSAAQLSKIAKILNIEISYFFASGAILPFHAPAADSFRASQIINEPETASLVKSYSAISDYRTRMAINELVSSITKLITKRAKNHNE